MDTILNIEGISKSFGNRKILRDLTFSVNRGEFLSILGPSGCGKTTLLRILIGLLATDGGHILKDGKDITAFPPDKRGMGIVFQDYALFQNMTVLGNVEYALRIRRKTRPDARKLAIDMLQMVGMEEHMKKKPASLSGGQQQRVAIARTLALKPDIILFDEPMSALDANTRNSLSGELKRIQSQSNATMIYITHDQEEAFVMSDRILVMEQGVIQQFGTPHQIFHNPANEYVGRFVVQNLRYKAEFLAGFLEVQGNG